MSLEELRGDRDAIEYQLLGLLGVHLRLSEELRDAEVQSAGTAQQAENHEAMVAERVAIGQTLGIPEKLVRGVWALIREAS